MSAPFNNKNHLKYPPEKVKRIFTKAIKEIKDKQIFNYPELHRSIGLSTLRTLPYLANRYQDNPELMILWNDLKHEMNKNLQKKIAEFELNRQFGIGNAIIEIA